MILSVIRQGHQLNMLPTETFCAPFAVSINDDVRRECEIWHNVGMFDTSISGEVTQLMALYEFRNELRVKEFLTANPFLPVGLMLAADAVRSYFPDAQLALDVYKDREDSTYQLLALRIITHKRYPGSREQMKRFRNEWWTKHITAVVRERIAVGVEPV